MLTITDRILGGIYGLLIGDALGVPYEFSNQAEIPKLEEIEFIPPSGFNGAHANIAPGTWSDDGAQALLLLASLLKCGKLDIDDFAEGLVQWFESGYMAVDNHVFDIGNQTLQAIQNLRNGVNPSNAGLNHEQTNGNGSLMRVLPLALWHKGSDEDLVKDAHLQSTVTHGHIRSQICCALYCLWARYSLENNKNAWSKATASLKAIYGSHSEEYTELMQNIKPDDGIPIQGTGYVVDTLHSAKWAMQKSSYENVVKTAITLGNDTDTTACVAGGVAGIRYGINEIPIRWVGNLRGREIIDVELEKLIVWRCG